MSPVQSQQMVGPREEVARICPFVLSVGLLHLRFELSRNKPAKSSNKSEQTRFGRLPMLADNTDTDAGSYSSGSHLIDAAEKRR